MNKVPNKMRNITTGLFIFFLVGGLAVLFLRNKWNLKHSDPAIGRMGSDNRKAIPKTPSSSYHNATKKSVPGEIVLKRLEGDMFQEGIINEIGVFIPSEGKQPIRIAHDDFPISVPPIYGEPLTNALQVTVSTQKQEVAVEEEIVLKSIGDGYYQEGVVDKNGRFTPSKGKKPIRIAHDTFPISVPPIQGVEVDKTFNLTEYLNKDTDTVGDRGHTRAIDK